MKITPETPIDDIIEYILEHLNTVQVGGCVDVPGFCARTNQGYDRKMEPRVREKMYRFGVARRCTGSNQPETAVMLTPKGAEVYESGGWKMHLKQIEKEAQAHSLAKYEQQQQDRLFKEEEREISRSNNQAARRSVQASWFAGAVALMAFLLAGFQYFESRSQNTHINELSSKLKALDSLLKVRQQDQLQMKTRLDSLPIRKI